MLKKITFSNYKSFKNTTIINLVASNSLILKETNVYNNILKGCVFFGPNSAGKTNALWAIGLLLEMLFQSENNHYGDDICVFSKNNIASFCYEFEILSKNIIYNFSFDSSGNIVEEKLLLQEKTIYQRSYNNINLIDGNLVIKNNQIILKQLFNNHFFEKNDTLLNWQYFLENSLFVRANNFILTSSGSLDKDSFVNDFLEKYHIDYINNFLSNYKFPFTLIYEKKSNDYCKNLFIKKDGIDILLPYAYESTGNKNLIFILTYILSIIKTGGILAVDEFNVGLHNKLEELLIYHIFKNSKNIQLFIVSQSTNLLKNSLFRPDQINIVDFSQDGSFIKNVSSENPRESQNLEKMYLSGVFGGIPQYEKNQDK